MIASRIGQPKTQHDVKEFNVLMAAYNEEAGRVARVVAYTINYGMPPRLPELSTLRKSA